MEQHSILNYINDSLIIEVVTVKHYFSQCF